MWSIEQHGEWIEEGNTVIVAPSGEILAGPARQEETILYADVDLATAASSHARRLFMQHRRPDLYPEWFKSPAGS